MKYFYLVIGGALGTLMRYWISVYFNAESFPFGTFLANMTGSFLIGIFAGLGAEHITSNVRLFAVTGVLGGFTTFSSLSLEGLNMLQSGKSVQGFIYLGGSCILGLAAAGTGFIAGRYIRTQFFGVRS